MKLPSVHRVIELRGSPRASGQEYGGQMAEAISGFSSQELTLEEENLDYARRCSALLGSWNPALTCFVEGMADGCGRPLEEVVLLLLHEEIVHTKNCTALGATGRGTVNGEAVVGQNWDWSTTLYAWSHLTRYGGDELPASIFYSYPGLWASAGINEHGMSLVWTGSGYLPKVRPTLGVPTYLLIAGILAQKNCRDALTLLEQTPIAGCFIFFLADASGEVWVVEGLPGRFEAERCNDVIGRANHYECREMCDAAQQQVPAASLEANSASRARRMGELLERHRGRIDGNAVEAILTDHGVGPGLDICQHPVPGRNALTLDSFYALPARREFRIARGAPCRRQFTAYSV